MKKTILLLITFISPFIYGDMVSELNNSLDHEYKTNSKFRDFYHKLMIKNDCHLINDTIVINCEISKEVFQNNIVNMSYQSTPLELYETYKSFHFIFHQGTQMENSVVYTVDYETVTLNGNIQVRVTSFSEL